MSEALAGEPQSSSDETTKVQLDEAEREGVEPFELEFVKELFSVGGRGHHIQRETFLVDVCKE